MKRFFYALLVVAATLTFVSCNEDIEENVSDSQILESNTIAFTLKKNELDTRSESGSAVAEPESYPLGDPIDGQQVYLKETVVSLDNIYYEEPETKGTPVYTENFATVSEGSFKGLAFPVATMNDVAAPAPNAQANLPMPAGLFTFDGNRWLRDWNNWGSKDALLFYDWMLTEDENPQIGQRVGALTNSFRYFYTDAGVQSMTFSYRSAAKAEAQEDILFAARPIAKSGPTPIPLVFYHALTGVKFATAHANSALNDVNTYIKKVEFTGMYGYGKCTVTSTTDGGNYTDTPSDHSSARAISWNFSGNAATNSLKNVYSQDFSETPVDYTTGSFATQGNYPSSFSAAGNKRNLNDGDATMTFWFPPQTMTDDSKLTITFEIEINDTRKEYTREISLGDLTSNGEWKAGELRTLTLLSTEVIVEIEDTVEGNVKKDVVITNMGNTPAYMRVQIVGNWYGKAGTEEGIAMGYKSDVETDMNYVEPWNDVLNTSADYTPYGTFSGLPGNNWIKGKDGYFYYTKLVYPGESIQDKIFTSYTLDRSKIPTIYYTNNQPQRIPFTDVHLVIDIPVQAVMAPLKPEWTVENPQYEEDYKKAWLTAGVTVEEA
jgi:hypothetical protein